MIFSVKAEMEDGHNRHKARFVVGGHKLDSTGYDTYSSTVKNLSVKLLLIITEHMGLNIMAADVAMVEKIYQLAGLEMTGQARAELQAFIDAHPRGKHGRIVYDLRRDFGAQPEELRERFATYCAQFPVRIEVR